GSGRAPLPAGHEENDQGDAARAGPRARDGQEDGPHAPASARARHTAGQRGGGLAGRDARQGEGLRPRRGQARASEDEWTEEEHHARAARDARRRAASIDDGGITRARAADDGDRASRALTGADTEPDAEQARLEACPAW